MATHTKRASKAPSSLRHGLAVASAACLSTCLVVAAHPIGVMAQQNAAPPNFSSSAYGWVRVGTSQDFDAVPGTIPPVGSDPAHPFTGNNTGSQTTYRIADLSNPNLTPWTRERMQKDNEEVLAGKTAFTARQSCMPGGVPAFMAYGGNSPIWFIQTPKEVWMIYAGDQQVRRVYLDVPHSKNIKPSWYGESVGHYEGDTLVIDTIGQNDRTKLDPYRTPHSEKLHVVERWRMVDDSQIMQVIFTVEDSEAFHQPWTGMKRFRRGREEILEEVCAENNQHFDFRIPTADRPDF